MWLSNNNSVVLVQMELYEAKMKSALCLQQLGRDPTHMLQVAALMLCLVVETAADKHKLLPDI